MLWCQLLGHANAESILDRVAARTCVGLYMQKRGTRFVLGSPAPVNVGGRRIGADWDGV